ncbi:restriction endonuclease subunit S [Enterococcus faecalis]|uniref:restriction endonuclease subunit S n=1 Tax=Enterococcus faecalis TaxID=1351 RepID=UPI00142F772C|nr:restriction endonuclease subunit S [Enterococcus faecalis]NJJ99547.1 restriction endonuclease subunit S [Enterococcus faecalis]
MKFKEYKLSDVVQIIGGGTPKRSVAEYWNGEIPWISIKDFSSTKRINFTQEAITSLGLQKSSSKILDKDDIVISARGTVGLVAQLGKPMAFNQSCYGLKAREMAINDFLYYWLKQNVTYVKANTHGSVFDTITKDTFNNLLIKLPSLKKQKKIVSILDSIDSKIEINNQIISNLEELASTLFKRWFVDFEFPDENGNPYKSSGGKMVDSELGKIPEGWELRTLGYFSEIIMGQSPKGESYNNDNSGLPLLNGASDFKNGIISPLKYTTEPKKVTQKGDFIFGVRATVGHVTESDGIYAIGRGTGLARTKNYYAKEFLYFSLKNIIRYLELTASGSVYVNISKKELNDFKLIYPANRILQLFHRTTVNLFKEKMNKYIENQFLTELRDSLLPKLLSGEIELPEDEEV